MKQQYMIDRSLPSQLPVPSQCWDMIENDDMNVFRSTFNKSSTRVIFVLVAITHQGNGMSPLTKPRMAKSLFDAIEWNLNRYIKLLFPENVKENIGKTTFILWSLYFRTSVKWTPLLTPAGNNNRPVPQIPQCIIPLSHNAQFCNSYVHISVAEWCIVGYLSDALWDYSQSCIIL